MSFLFNFLWKTLLASNVGPDQTQHDMASDLCLHCLPMTLLRVSRYNGLNNLNTITVHGTDGVVLFLFYVHGLNIYGHVGTVS